MTAAQWKDGAPGSDLARSLGCRCPVLDNGRGRGRGGDGEKFGWVFNGDCPVHVDLPTPAQGSTTKEPA